MSTTRMMTRFFCLMSLALLMACGGKPEAETSTAVAPAAISGVDSLRISQIVGIANIQPLAEIIPITPEAAGKIVRIGAAEGVRVEKGSVLLELDHTVEGAQVDQASAKLATQQAVISTQQATIASLRVRLDQARTTHERNVKLHAGNALTLQQLQDSEAAWKTLEQDLAGASAALQQQERRLKELQTDVAYFKTLVQKKYVFAPLSGSVLALDAKLGEYVQPAVQVGEFAPEGNLMAITEVDELFASRVSIGDKAYIRPQGGEDTIATGRVVFAAPYLKKKSLFSDGAANLEDRRVREVRVELNPAQGLLIGARVECVILIP
ncbi:MAG: efflux RND transporter periplasmic adaptor subunit [Bacteroidia bacterium]|nr:efflux RND transporter periplasmic adaptor subunit [Bacteroidia bacterium]